MAKKRGGGNASAGRGGGRRLGGRPGAPSSLPPPNPFESFGKVRKKHDVLGKRTKAGPALTQARSEAVERRKRTLLVEYRSAARSNAFVDRRFGEDDPGLGEEDRALLRLQKQRLRESGGGGAGGGRGSFALPDAGDAGLTHLGRSLADDGWGGGGIAAPSDEEDEDGGRGALGADFVHSAHFGGGEEVEPPAGGDAAAAPRRKTKAEVMAELMAKSKAHKAARQAERAADADTAGELDAAFAKLTAAGALGGLLKNPGEKEPKKGGATDAAALDAAYDRARADMQAGHGRAAPERPKPAEHEGRKKRARVDDEEEGGGDDGGGAEEEDDFEGGAPALEALAAGGGYAGRRARRELARLRGAAVAGRREKGSRGGDDEEEEEEEESESGSEGGSSSGGEDAAPAPSGPAARAAARARAATADANPLQLSANAALAALAAKHGLKRKEEEESEEEGGSGSESEPADSSSDEEETAAPAARAPRTPAKPAPSDASPLPYATFLEAVGDAAAAAFPGAVAGLRRPGGPAGGRAGAQALAAHLARFYGEVAARAPALPLSLLEAVAAEFVGVAKDVPFYAAAVARARLGRARARLVAGLKGNEDSSSTPAPLSPWPDARDAALLRLWIAAFPPTPPPEGSLAPGSPALVYGGPNAPAPPRAPGIAASGPVAGAATALGAAYLSLCALASRRDVGLSLVVGHTLADAAAAFNPGPAWCPEALCAAVAVVSGAAGLGGPRWALPAFAWPSPTRAAWAKVKPAKSSLSLGAVLGPEALSPGTGVRRSPSLDGDASFPAAALSAAFALLSRCAGACSGFPATPAALEPAAAALAALAKVGLAPDLEAARAGAQAAVAAACAATTAARVPLARTRAASSSIPPGGAQTLNPRFEAGVDGAGWAPNRDFDPDRERSAARALKRQVARETRGAMRELRKDSAFLAGARSADAEAAKAARKAAARAGRVFMEGQAADARSGGQRGNWKKRKDK